MCGTITALQYNSCTHFEITSNRKAHLGNQMPRVISQSQENLPNYKVTSSNDIFLDSRGVTKTRVYCEIKVGTKSTLFTTSYRGGKNKKQKTYPYYTKSWFSIYRTCLLSRSTETTVPRQRVRFQTTLFTLYCIKSQYGSWVTMMGQHGHDTVDPSLLSKCGTEWKHATCWKDRQYNSNQLSLLASHQS